MSQITTENEISISQKEKLHAEIREKAKEQGVKPISKIEDLQNNVWAKDVNIDEFLEWVDEIRSSDTNNK